MPARVCARSSLCPYFGLALVLAQFPAVIWVSGICIIGAIATFFFGLAVSEIVGSQPNPSQVSFYLVISVIFSFLLVWRDGPFVPSVSISALVGVGITLKVSSRPLIGLSVSALYYCALALPVTQSPAVVICAIGSTCCFGFALDVLLRSAQGISVAGV